MNHEMQLEQRLGLQQILAPQLQQSLSILQAPVLELRALIERELEQNPVLEEIPPEELLRQKQKLETGIIDSDSDPTEPPSDVIYDPTKEEKGPIDDFHAEISKLIAMDEEWKEVFSKKNPPLKTAEESQQTYQYMLNCLTSQPTLQEYLLQQARMADMTEQEFKIAEYIIGNLDENGYLTLSIPEIALAVSALPQDVEKVLKIIQEFDPPGIGARNLRECLMLQLEHAKLVESLEYKMLKDHPDLVARKRIIELAKILNVSVQDIEQAFERLARLNPRPGKQFINEGPSYVVPELEVKKIGGKWVVETKNELIPHLRISNYYKDLLGKMDVPEEVKEYIRQKIRAARFIIKCIHQRQDTIKRIAEEIVRRQEEFFEKGPAHIKPLTMAQVANAVGLHETTVSRAVNGKYVSTPWGVFELKRFFSSGLTTIDGTQVSNQTVKQKIYQFIKSEDPRNPLSDEDIVQLLAKEGIKVARRTVAKYRTELGIPPSHLRKVYS